MATPRFSRDQTQFDRITLNPNVIGGGARIAPPSDTPSRVDHLVAHRLDEFTTPCSKRRKLAGNNYVVGNQPNRRPPVRL